MNGEQARGGIHAIRDMNREELAAFVSKHLTSMGEDEAVAVLGNRFCAPMACVAIAGNSRLASYYDVKLRLVTCRSTPQHIALKLVRHLYWADLVRHSIDVQISPPVRAAIDAQLLTALPRLTIGEKLSTAKTCSREVGKVLAGDPDLRVFSALLSNPRLREDDLVVFLQSERAGGEHMKLVADHSKWGCRYAVRLAIASSPVAPRAVAASQLRHLKKEDREGLLRRPDTSTYIRRCVEALGGGGPQEGDRGGADESVSGGIGYNGGSNE